ncbi:hypothetical protein ACFV0Y_07435 [Streptomyces sp. NPDC059569]|uniref:hypothetical protein n=1 Tax=Streptomyces sp. NPDC059569 TaxID=3346869 RepID=UPI0036CE3DB1
MFEILFGGGSAAETGDGLDPLALFIGRGRPGPGPADADAAGPHDGQSAAGGPAPVGHAHLSTPCRYIRHLKDPMREVDDAFREWTAAGGASYAAIARSLMSWEDAGHATPRPVHP